MKSTPAQREWIRRLADDGAQVDGFDVLCVLDDFDEVAKQLEDARDQLQKMTIELGSIRGQMPGGDL